MAPHARLYYLHMPSQEPSQPASPAAAEHQSKHPVASGAKGLASIAWFIVNWLVIPAVIVFLLHTFVFQAFHVVGHSMAPTLEEADYLIISKVDKTFAGLHHQAYIPKRGQVVIFHFPKDPTLVFVKRVIGEPGDHVVVKDGAVRVYNAAHPNGFDPDDGSFKTSDPTTLGNFDDVIPDGNIFVIGDNRLPGASCRRPRRRRR